MELSRCCRFVALSAVLLLGACASDVPLLIRQSPADGVSLAQARQEPDRFDKVRVRWGGEIVAVENLSNTTLVEVFAKPLGDDGKPYGDQGKGRFMARFPGFVDPMRYAKKRLLTVTGTLTGRLNRKIGEYRYDYPVVEVIAHHLWPKPVSYPSAPYPWNPFPYDPWWPYHRHPYHSPYWY